MSTSRSNSKQRDRRCAETRNTAANAFAGSLHISRIILCWISDYLMKVQGTVFPCYTKYSKKMVLISCIGICVFGLHPGEKFSPYHHIQRNIKVPAPSPLSHVAAHVATINLSLVNKREFFMLLFSSVLMHYKVLYVLQCAWGCGDLVRLASVVCALLLACLSMQCSYLKLPVLSSPLSTTKKEFWRLQLFSGYLRKRLTRRRRMSLLQSMTTQVWPQYGRWPHLRPSSQLSV